MKKHSIALFYLCIALAFLLATLGGCSSTTGLAGRGSAPSSSKPIKIGWLGPLTGDLALWGQAEHEALVMLLEGYNAAGGIEVGGRMRRLELLAYDDRSDKDEAAIGAQRLVGKDKVVAIVGPQGSFEAYGIQSIMDEAGVPAILTTATNPRVTVDENGLVHRAMFRACFIDPYQGELMAAFAYERLGARKAAILNIIDDAFSVDCAEAFKEAFSMRGGKIVMEHGFFDGEKDFRPQLAKIKAAEPDVIFSPNYYNDVAASARQARDFGLETIMLGGDGWPSENLIALAGDALEGCYFVNHLDYGDPDPAMQAFRKAFRERYKRNPEMNSYFAHDALLMIVDAIRRAGTTEAKALIASLEETDIQGLTGCIKMGPTHDPVGKVGAIIKIVGREMLFQERYGVGAP